MPLFDSTFSAFARGSLMSTAQGYVAIEDLLPGDNLHISSGEAAKILWIGSSTFVPAAPDRRMPLDQIMANTFGVSRPSSFLTIGPSADCYKRHTICAATRAARKCSPMPANFLMA